MYSGLGASSMAAMTVAGRFYVQITSSSRFCRRSVLQLEQYIAYIEYSFLLIAVASCEGWYQVFLQVEDSRAADVLAAGIVILNMTFARDGCGRSPSFYYASYACVGGRKSCTDTYHSEPCFPSQPNSYVSSREKSSLSYYYKMPCRTIQMTTLWIEYERPLSYTFSNIPTKYNHVCRVV